MDDAVKEELHCRLACLDVLRESECLLHVSADLGEAGLELLVTVVLAFPAGLIAPVVLVAALGQGRDANVQMNTKQWRATSIWW